MFFEMLVLDGGYCVEENSWALLVSHENAALEGEAADELAVVCVNFRDDVWAVGFERVNFRQIAGVNEKQAGRGPRRMAQNRRNESATRSISFQPRRRRVIGGG